MTTPDTTEHQGTSLRDFLQVLRRRKWILLLAALAVPGIALNLALSQDKVYQGTAEVLLGRQNAALSVTNTPDLTPQQEFERVAQTQARLAATPPVAQRVLRALNLRDRDADSLLGSTVVAAAQNTDILAFTVFDTNPRLASRLATEFARQYTGYRRELDTASMRRARAEVERQLPRVRNRDRALYATLVQKREQLRTLEALQTSNAYVVREASKAQQITPRPRRAAIIGAVLGLLLGIGLALLREALDTRVRSAEEIADRLGLTLLARVTDPPRALRTANKLVMLEEPHGVRAEAFRMLRANLEFSNIERRARTIMVTSAVQSEGKSTTAANLAVALARSGRRVILVDLDLRRPFLDKFFDVSGSRGLTAMAMGRATADDVLVRVPLTEVVPAAAPANGRGEVGDFDFPEPTTGAHGDALPARRGRPGLLRGLRGADRPQPMVDLRPPEDAPARPVERRPARDDREGMLEVLPTGPVPPNPGEFVGSRMLGDILDTLSARADIVIVDTPPMLQVGDAMTLSARVDGLVLIARLDVLRRPMLKELDRLLHQAPAPALGFVLTGADDQQSGYGYGYGYYGEKQESKQESRAPDPVPDPVD